MEAYTNDTIKRELETIMETIKDREFNNESTIQMVRLERLIKSAMENVARQKAIDIKNVIETL